MALQRMCKCGKLIEHDERCCKACEEEYKKMKATSDKYYDRNKRDKRSAAFYNSAEWATVREYVIQKHKGLDLYAYFVERKIVYAEAVHHVVELKEDWDLRLDINNLVPLSNKSHSKIHKLYKKDKKGTQTLLMDLKKKWENISV